MALEFVNVPVPLERMQEVYELLARPGRGAPRVTGGPSEQPCSWADDLLVRAYRESPPAMKTVFDHLVAHADEWVTSDDLRGAIAERQDRPDYTRGQLAGVLGAFGRRWKNRYKGGGDPDGRWPFEAESSTEHGMLIYRMSAAAAAVLREPR